MALMRCQFSFTSPLRADSVTNIRPHLNRYERILISIDRQGQNSTARQILEWLCCAKRPPRVAELRRIIPLTNSDTTFSHDNILPESLGIENICGSIVEIED